MERMINSVLDQDMYKLTMQQFVHHRYPEAVASYQFINRGKTVFPDGFADKLRNQVEMVAELKLQPQEGEFLANKTNGILSSDYLAWLEEWRPDPSQVKIRQDEGELVVDIHGKWESAIYWEVPLMAMISEQYFAETGQSASSWYLCRAREKAMLYRENQIKYADFGTRRRFSQKVHETVVEVLRRDSGNGFLGTSNVDLARRYELKPIGTNAHELYMGTGALNDYVGANRQVLLEWNEEFGGKLNTALTDTYTTEVFLRDYCGEIAQLYTTLRQDSGDPKEFVRMLLRHCRRYGINQEGLTVLFSDSLNPQKVLELHEFSKGKVIDLYGIGTNLSNDVGVKPLNMVIKLFNIARNLNEAPIPTAKFSDDPGKTSGDLAAVDKVRELLWIGEQK